MPGGTAIVDVFVDSAVGIRGYQVELSVATNVEIDTSREDYLFADTESISAVDAARGRLAGARHVGGRPTEGTAYLGSFAIDAREERQHHRVVRVILIDSSGRELDSRIQSFDAVTAKRSDATNRLIRR